MDFRITGPTFAMVQESLCALYLDADHVPKNVRRSILEASVRAPQDWHRDAVRAAFSTDDEEWRLTSVDSAWPRVTALLDPSKTERSLLLAAIDAVASIRPDIAPEVLNDLGGSEDDEIATAVFDALALQEAMRER
jgi:hypothetical protein